MDSIARMNTGVTDVTRRAGNAGSDVHPDAAKWITLSQAAKEAPGRPSSNAVWRWCRRGVISRNGERVYLRHIRVGGKVLTRSEWVAEFGEKLAEADRRYFSAQQEAAAGIPPRAAEFNPAKVGACGSVPSARTITEIDQELSAEGL